MEERGWRVSNLTTDEMLKEARINYLENIDRAKTYRPEIKRHIFEDEKIIRLYKDVYDNLVCLTNKRLMYLGNSPKRHLTHNIPIKNIDIITNIDSKDFYQIQIITKTKKALEISFYYPISELVARDIMKVMLSY